MVHINELALTLKDRHDRQQTNRKMPTLRKIKRAAIQPQKPNQIAAHLILPNRNLAHPAPNC
jgi:hypothetical protein